VVAGTLMMAAALALLPATHSVPSLMAVMALLALGSGINNPSLSSLTSRAVDATEQGSILGAAQGFSSLARAVGPFCAGWLFDLGMAYPYLAAAAIMAAAFFLSLRVLGERQEVAAAT
jgi:MFS transporter, DHA1 family, tetracycline resistance protein